jgi:1-acyl-sn-glycerol-3-phosphate acyltransferase
LIILTDLALRSIIRWTFGIIEPRRLWNHDDVSGVDRSASARPFAAAPSDAALDEPFLTRWSRRALTIPGFLLATAAAVVCLPIAVLVTLVLDARGGRRLPRTRFALGIVFLLLCETAGIAGSFVTWTLAGVWLGAGTPRAYRLDRALQRWWAGALLHGGRRILGLGLRVTAGEGLFDAGPVLVLARHASVVDSLLPLVLLHPFRLRYVLKRELVWDPCLDLVGNRLPNAFVLRGIGDVGEIARVGALATGLGPDEGVVLFPEGTRFTPERREDLITRLDARGETPRLHEAGSLRHVLPPRRGGVLVMLEASPEADVIVLAHTGLEEAARLGDLWRGSLLGGEIEVEMWRVPRARIPPDAVGREAWLRECWRDVDDWVERRRTMGAR